MMKLCNSREIDLGTAMQPVIQVYTNDKLLNGTVVIHLNQGVPPAAVHRRGCAFFVTLFAQAKKVKNNLEDINIYESALLTSSTSFCHIELQNIFVKISLTPVRGLGTDEEAQRTKDRLLRKRFFKSTTWQKS